MFRQELPDDVRQKIQHQRDVEYGPSELDKLGPEPNVGMYPPFPFISAILLLGVVAHVIWFVGDAVLVSAGVVEPTTYPLVRNALILAAMTVYTLSLRGSMLLHDYWTWKRNALEDCGKMEDYWRPRDTVVKTATLLYAIHPAILVPIAIVAGLSWLLLYAYF